MNARNHTGLFAMMLGMCMLALYSPGCTIYHAVEPAAKREHRFADGGTSVTWIGHSSFLVQADGVNILTDPMYDDYIRYGLPLFKRYREPAVPFAGLPRVDAVIISHEHPDHLNRRTLSMLPKSTPVILAKGNGDRVKELGFTDVRELEWWDETETGGITITATPAFHGGARCAGYVMKGTKTVFFAGDTVVIDAFREIGRKFSIDLALLPIGEYRARVNLFGMNDWLKRSQHMGPPDMPRAIEMLKCRKAMPMHWGTFDMQGLLSVGIDTPAVELAAIAKRLGLEERIIIPGFGGRYVLSE